jgi:hypothetical protein
VALRSVFTEKWSEKPAAQGAKFGLEAMALVVGWAVGKGIGVSSASNSGTEAKR